MALNDFDDFDSPLQSGGGTRYASPKFNEVGDRFVGMVIDYDDKAPLFVYGTQQRAVTDAGKEKTKDIVTVLLMDGTTCAVSDPQGGEGATLDNPVGVVAKVHIQGHNRWTPDARPVGQRLAWRNALDEFGDFRRGCVVMGQFEATSRVGSNGAKLSQDKKIIGFAVRAAKPEEAPLVERCKQEYRALKEASAANAVPAEDEF